MVEVLSVQNCILSRCPHRLLYLCTLLLGVGLFYLTCLTTTLKLALPEGPIFSLFVLVTLALAAGKVVKMMRAPPMLGMLVVGLALSNIPVVKDATYIDPLISAALKTVALVIILLKGGLSINILSIKQCGLAVVRLAVIPCFIEAGVAAVCARYLLDLPWIWSWMLGFVIAAVTPAIIIPCLMEIKNRGFRVEENNITTMLISASSFDDVIAISAFMICLSSAFSHDETLVMKVLHGPLEIGLGLCIGVGVGLLLWVLPPTRSHAQEKTGESKRVRCALLVMCGLSSTFGMTYLNYSGAGPLSVIVMALVAKYGWKESGFIKEVLDEMWYIMEPLLFGLVSRDIQVELITAELLWRSIILIFISLIFRCASAYASVCWTDTTWKERLFVAIAWIPRATVQAAIGSYALALAIEHHESPVMITYSEIVVTVAVLTILLTAPLGSLLMYFSAPYLLTQTKVVDKHRDESTHRDEITDIKAGIKESELAQTAVSYSTIDLDIKDTSEYVKLCVDNHNENS